MRLKPVVERVNAAGDDLNNFGNLLVIDPDLVQNIKELGFFNVLIFLFDFVVYDVHTWSKL